MHVAHNSPLKCPTCNAAHLDYAAAQQSRNRLREVSLNVAGVAAEGKRKKRRKVVKKTKQREKRKQRRRLRAHLELKHLREHLLPLLPTEKIATLPSGSTLVNIAPGRAFFASQDAMFNNAVVKVNGIVQKNQDWLTSVSARQGRGPRPRSATFYSWYHPVVAWQLNNRVPGCFEYESFRSIKSFNVLYECLVQLKHLPSVFGQASKYYMSVGSDLEDTAIKLYVRQYCPEGVAVEEFLRTAPYSAVRSRSRAARRILCWCSQT